MEIDSPTFVEYQKEYRKNQTLNKDTFQEYVKYCHPEFVNEKPSLIIFTFDKKDDAMYQDIKYSCDVQLGIPCQCVSDRVIDTCWNAHIKLGQLYSVFTSASSSDFTTISNILLKINTKFKGINNLIADADKVDIMKKRTMIIGADVTHPDAGDKISTSIAAITASFDPDHWFYYPCIRVQYGYSEIINETKDMFLEIARHYFEKNGHLPDHVIFYRDGVSDGMFADVIDKEIGAMKAAFAHVSAEKLKFGAVPKITFVVVQKRHHTRFMVKNEPDANVLPSDATACPDLITFSPKLETTGADQEESSSESGSVSTSPGSEQTPSGVSKSKWSNHKFGKGGNIFGGTTIDTKIIHPVDYDFFLCSHDCVQGTPRPAHYYVLLDENLLPPDDLYKITFQMCHSYAPATRALSIPAPVQYAHLAAKRSRHHLIASRAERVAGVSIWQKMNEHEKAKKTKDINQSIFVRMPLKGTMYFI